VGSWLSLSGDISPVRRESGVIHGQALYKNGEGNYLTLLGFEARNAVTQ
jgi:hypothetical protein